MGELHLEIIVDRLLREFNVEANIGQPQVAFKESIGNSAKGEGKFIKQTGGRGQYGHVLLTIEPLDRGEGFEFENKWLVEPFQKNLFHQLKKVLRARLNLGLYLVIQSLILK